MLNKNVKRFVTSKPEGFKFEPGQATNITLLRDGYRSEPRPFTFTSIPKDEDLEFIIKLYYERDGVTDEMSDVKNGEKFQIDEAKGAISYQGPGVFIAGGAGITPFISIIRKLGDEGNLDGHSLWFSNSTEDDIFLEDELRDHFNDSNLKLLVSEPSEQTDYHAGKIDKQFLEAHEETLKEGFVYVCGPPQMTEDIVGLVKDLGVDEGMIVHEDWSD